MLRLQAPAAQLQEQTQTQQPGKEVISIMCLSKELDKRISSSCSYRVHNAAAGDRPTERVVFCNICKNNGFPHEAIDFRKVSSGRIKNDGSYEFERYEVMNYFTSGKHEHRHRKGVQL